MLGFIPFGACISVTALRRGFSFPFPGLVLPFPPCCVLFSVSFIGALFPRLLLFLIFKTQRISQKKAEDFRRAILAPAPLPSSIDVSAMVLHPVVVFGRIHLTHCCLVVTLRFLSFFAWCPIPFGASVVPSVCLSLFYFLSLVVFIAGFFSF